MKKGVDEAAALAWAGSLSYMAKHDPDIAPGELRMKNTERLAKEGV